MVSKGNTEAKKLIKEATKLYKIERTMTSEEKTNLFIKRSEYIFGDLYDYTKTNVTLTHLKVEIICKKHGSFFQTPTEHMSGTGCFECKGTKKHTLDTFIEKANDVHKNKYDYSKVNYVNGLTKIIIICKVHGEFEQLPTDHACGGKGCAKCSNVYNHTTQEWIENMRLLQNDKYDYSKTIYTTNKTPVIIICHIHGEFIQNPDHHNQGKGCSKCAKCYNYTTSEWIENMKLLHNNKYDYSKTIYIKNMVPVTIICPIHGEFIQKPIKHVDGHGCTLCVNKSESKLFSLLKKNFSDVERQAYFSWSKSPYSGMYFKFDFHIKTINCIVELDGDQHFKQVRNWNSPEFCQKRDIWKVQRANENGISIIRVYCPNLLKKSEKWFDDNVLKLLIKRNELENLYVTDPKDIDIYDKHKKLLQTKVLLDKNDDNVSQ